MPYTTDQYEGMTAETVAMQGHNGDWINAYYARPLGPGPFPGVVLIHHAPGWDEWYREATRKFAHHGYAAISPNLYFRAGHGTPADVTARIRAEGGVPDEQAVGDIAASARVLRELPNSTGKVAVFGTCSGGRHAMLAASCTDEFDAVVDCWGGGVVMKPEDLSEKRPVAPIDYTKDLNCPVLGLFGDEDHSPTADQVDMHEEALKAHGKEYEFHRYAGAGHGFFYYQSPMYRQEAAVDGWNKIWDFLERKLGA